MAIVGTYVWRQLQVPVWDYVVLDEAHRLKNKDAKALAALQSLNTSCKLALTG